MARAFRRTRHGVAARLEPYEVEVLRRLVSEVTALVTARPEGDPAHDRLFPDPSHDAKAAAEVRELIEDDLREAKLAAARALLESLPDDGAVEVDVETAEQWLTALNDVRLALGTRLGITEDDYEVDPEDDAMHVFQWVTFLQESLVQAVSAHGVQR